MRWHWKTHSSRASLSQFFPRFTPRLHYHQVWTTGRPLSEIWTPQSRIHQDEAVNPSNMNSDCSDADLAITHTLDTSMPMVINQSQPRPKMHTCYNCSDKGHLLCACPKPQKQRMSSADSAEGDIKNIVAEAVTAAMDSK